MTLQSFSDPDTTYEVTIKDERAVECSCPDRYYRKHNNPNHQCKHMRFITSQLEAAKREREENRGCYLRMMQSPF